MVILSTHQLLGSKSQLPGIWKENPVTRYLEEKPSYQVFGRKIHSRRAALDASPRSQSGFLVVAYSWAPSLNELFIQSNIDGHGH